MEVPKTNNFLKVCELFIYFSTCFVDYHQLSDYVLSGSALQMLIAGT